MMICRMRPPFPTQPRSNPRPLWSSADPRYRLISCAAPQPRCSTSTSKYVSALIQLAVQPVAVCDRLLGTSLRRMPSCAVPCTAVPSEQGG